LKRRLDAMDNEEFQSVLSGPVSEVPDRLAATREDRRALSKLLASLSPTEWHRALTNLGGHDQETLASSFRAAESAATPAVVFAHTIKGWKLPFAGDPLNHSALMSRAQLEDLAASFGIGEDYYERLDPASPGGKIVEATRARLNRAARLRGGYVAVPATIDISSPERISSQQAFGRTLTALARSHPAVARRVVTASPDVSISTNLSGWINRVGAWHATPRRYYGRASRLLKWNEGPNGQHLELSLSEMNLFGLITQLGLSAKTFGPALAPIGTVYDCFIRRGLDAFVYGLYSGSSFVIVGTPSGVSLAPEGGAHQSTLTPGLGVSLPGLISYEPCFAPEVEWTLLAGIDRALNQQGSTYLRLSTLPIDQRWFPLQHSSLRRQVLDGAYRLIDRRTESSYLPEHAVLIFATGTAVPAACQASNVLLSEGIFASVVNVTSADRLFGRWNSTAMTTIEEARHQPDPFPHLLSSEEVGLPALMVADGHPHNLAFLGTALQVPSISIGVSGFGESGTVGDLFRKHHLDTESLVNAAVALLDRATPEGEVAR